MFKSAHLKLQRANHHIGDLERQFDAFVAEKPHRFSVQHDPETGEAGLRMLVTKQVPPEIALIIGDAIHNLRVALDHAAWELVGADNGTQDRYLKFPTGNNRVNFEASCQGIKTPSQWVKDFFKSVEAFPGGRGDPLYTLKTLNDADKHTFVMPMVRATTHPRVSVFHADGRLCFGLEGNVFAGGVEEYIPMMDIPRGMSVKVDDDQHCAPTIFFEEGDTPIIPSLWRMAQEVAGVLDGACAARKAANVP